MTNYQMLRMLATCKAGQAVQFGDIAVSMQGIGLNGGQKFIAWVTLCGTC